MAMDAGLVALLDWVAKKGIQHEVGYKPAAVRAFLLSITLDLIIGLDHDSTVC